MAIPPPPTTPSEWLALAEKTMVAANQMTNPAARSMLLEIAVRYRQLADEAVTAAKCDQSG